MNLPHRDLDEIVKERNSTARVACQFLLDGHTKLATDLAYEYQQLTEELEAAKDVVRRTLTQSEVPE